MSMPESLSHTHPGRDESDPYSTVSPPALSGIGGSWDTMNSPTYLSQPSQQSLSKASSVPPVVTGSNTPVLPPSPVISSSTPVFPVTPTGSIPTMQTPGETYVPTQISQPSFAVSGKTSVPPTLPDLSGTEDKQDLALVTPPVQRRRPGWRTIALVAAVLLIVLAGSGIYLFVRGTSTASPPIIGHAFFTSSGLLGGQSSNQGISDELVINLQNSA